MDDIGAGRVEQGLIVVYTGNGKGKTTAAFGLLLRGWGHGMRVGGIQFIKREGRPYGEQQVCAKLGIMLTPMGDGFTWASQDIEETRAHAIHGWRTAQEHMDSGRYDIFLLDEFTYPLHFGWIETNEVVQWFRARRPWKMHVIITGRYAPKALIDDADLVTEMHQIKHPFQSGIAAQAGIEY